MQDLSSEDKKIPPKNYQKQPKNVSVSAILYSVLK